MALQEVTNFYPESMITENDETNAALWNYSRAKINAELFQQFRNSNYSGYKDALNKLGTAKTDLKNALQRNNFYTYNLEHILSKKNNDIANEIHSKTPQRSIDILLEKMNKQFVEYEKRNPNKQRLGLIKDLKEEIKTLPDTMTHKEKFDKILELVEKMGNDAQNHHKKSSGWKIFGFFFNDKSRLKKMAESICDFARQELDPGSEYQIHRLN